MPTILEHPPTGRRTLKWGKKRGPQHQNDQNPFRGFVTGWSTKLGWSTRNTRSLTEKKVRGGKWFVVGRMIQKDNKAQSSRAPFQQHLKIKKSSRKKGTAGSCANPE